MGKKILVVDDEDGTRILVAKALEMKGHSIIMACDGVEGWEKVKAERPDLVILDVNMPRMNGIELLRKIREDADIGSLPTIMLTSQSSDEEVLAGLSSGADHYLTKPFSVTALCMTVDLVCGAGQ